MKTEDEILATIERHISGALAAFRELRKARATSIIRELRVSGALAAVRNLRVYVRQEKEKLRK